MKKVIINNAQDGLKQVEAMLNAFRHSGELVSRGMGQEAQELITKVKEFLSKQVGPISEVRDLMKERFVGPEEIKRIWGLDVMPVKLPKDPQYGDIMKVLNLDCPFEQGMKVWKTHYLTLVPMMIGNEKFNLAKLFELVGGLGSNVFRDNWFSDQPFAELTIKELPFFNEKLDKFGRYVLWYRHIPEVTKRKNWEDSRTELIKSFPNYRCCLVNELATGLVLIDKITGVKEYSIGWAWCEDYLPYGIDGSSSPIVFDVNFSSKLSINRPDPASTLEYLGSSACWNFRR
jgi:hypothetical protein